MSLRRQFSLLLLALFLTILSAVVLVSMSGTRRYLEQQLASHAQDAATTLSVTLGQSLGKGDAVLAQANVMTLFDRAYFKRITVLGIDHNPIIQREMAEKIEGVPLWFVAAFPIRSGTGEAFIGSGWKQLGKVLVVSQPTFAYQYLWRTTVQLLGWTVALCGLAGVLIQLMLYFILKPLRAIEKTARDVRDKHFGQISYRPRAPELADVVTAMNQMSHHVGEMLDAEAAKVQSLHKKAYQDDLTGLLNRPGFELGLSELLEHVNTFSLGSVVSVELDDIRLLIRAHGFSAGERIIRVVTETARSVFALLPLALLARSNEFAFTFVTVDQTESQATLMVKELQRRIQAQLADNEHAGMVSVTIGAAFFREREKLSAVLARVDLALASARHSGRNSLVLLPAEADPHSSLGSFGWRTLIQTALLENRLRLFRQPVVSLGINPTELQTECLGRLVDAQGQIIPASIFMPMAVRHGLITQVDRAVVTLSLSHLKESLHQPGMVAINLSPQSMADANFMNWFARQLTLLRNTAAKLAVEVPMFGVMINTNAATQLRDLVHKHGGQFGIDNFSPDPQALRRLREIPPDYVKLSGSSIAELATLATANEVLQTFVTLAHSLDVTVIAQQVDSIEQVTALTAAGVDAGQGNYFGAPR